MAEAERRAFLAYISEEHPGTLVDIGEKNISPLGHILVSIPKSRKTRESTQLGQLGTPSCFNIVDYMKSTQSSVEWQVESPVGEL